MTWQKMSRDQKVKAVREYLSLGYSAASVAAEIGGVTRNAIIGFARRNSLTLAGGTSRPTPRPKPKLKPVRIAPPRSVTIAEPMPAAPAGAWEPLAGVAPIGIMDLAGASCRWPVDGGYCGSAVERGSYCSAHGQRAYIGKGR